MLLYTHDILNLNKKCIFDESLTFRLYKKNYMYLVKLHEEETPWSPVGNTLNPPKEI